MGETQGTELFGGLSTVTTLLIQLGTKQFQSHMHTSQIRSKTGIWLIPSDLHVLWGRTESMLDPTPSQEVGTSNTWLQSGQLGIFKILSSKGFLPPVVFQSMNKEGLGEVL